MFQSFYNLADTTTGGVCMCVRLHEYTLMRVCDHASVFVCERGCVRAYVCLWTQVCACMRAFAHVPAFTGECVRWRASACVCARLHVYVCVCVPWRAYVCVCECVCLYARQGCMRCTSARVSARELMRFFAGAQRRPPE